MNIERLEQLERDLRQRKEHIAAEIRSVRQQLEDLRWAEQRQRNAEMRAAKWVRENKVLELREKLGLTYKEIGARFGVSTGRARALAFDAYKRKTGEWPWDGELDRTT